MRRVIVLGSTGSIGTQALEVIRANPRRFEVVGLSAGANRAAMQAQAEQFQVEHTALGAVEAEQLVRDVEADVVLNGITGSVGLGPTLAALETGRTLALANKESLIVGGDLVTAIAQPGQIVPVDSEHSAIAQALRSGDRSEVQRLVLTASGGPFRGRSRASLADVTPAEALAHPTWDMGRVVTTNSATLVNKGLEVIEAHLLFDVGVRPHRRRRAPAVDRALDGRVRRRLDDRPGIAARHAAADLARPGLAEPRGRGRPADRLDRRGIVDLRAARRGGLPGGAPRQEGRPRGRHLPGGLQRRERAGRRRLPRGPAHLPRNRRARSSASSTRTIPTPRRAARSPASRSPRPSGGRGMPRTARSRPPRSDRPELSRRTGRASAARAPATPRRAVRAGRARARSTGCARRGCRGSPGARAPPRGSRRRRRRA